MYILVKEQATSHLNQTKGSVLFLTGKLVLQVGFKTDDVLANRLNIPSTLISRHPQKVLYGKKIQPPNPVNVHLGYNILYICADCIEQQLVGDVQAQLLQNVCINNADSNNMQTSSFESPHYISVTKRDFDTIKIDIRGETGRKLPFQFGYVVVKLNFKLKRQALFQ